MWEQIEKPRTTQVSRQLVNEFNDMEALPRDRPLSERRLQVYERILAQGEFRPVTWASCFCKETNCTYRVNGKHTSRMLSGLPKLPVFYVTVERYKATTMEDVAKLYATFDSKIGMRTLSDIITSFASTANELNGLRKTILSLSVIAQSFSKWGLGFHVKPATERAELILDNIDFTVWANEILFPSVLTSGRSQKDGKHIWRSPVVTAMLETWNKAKSDSEKFWTAVRDENEQVGSPTRKLAKFLIGSSPRTSMKSAKDVVTFKEMYVRSVHAWNAWRREETTDLKYFPNAKIPAAY